MIAIMLFALFAASGILAVTVIGQNWRRYGAGALALCGQLKECDEWRDVDVTVRTISVHPAGARILRPDFKGRTSAPGRELLPAAA